MTTSWHDLAIQFLQVLFTALMPVVASALVWALVKVGQHFHIQVSVAQQDQMDQFLHKALSFAEETAAARVKAGQPAPSPQEKLKLAAGFVTSQLGNAAPLDVEAQLVSLLPSTLKMGATAK